MIRRSMLASLLAVAAMGSPTEAQQDLPLPPPSTPPGRAYKVAFWYELERPWSTAQYRAYDVAKGEYDEAAVARWQKTIFEKHPQMGCCVRDLTTVGMTGETEAERLKNAVEREKQRWADLNNNPSRSIRGLARSPSPIKPKEKSASRIGIGDSVPGSSGTPMYPTRSPFPYPYRSGPR
jgi:hypothetical protein